jgi:hypothetical protein
MWQSRITAWKQAAGDRKQPKFLASNPDSDYERELKTAILKYPRIHDAYILSEGAVEYCRRKLKNEEAYTILPKDRPKVEHDLVKAIVRNTVTPETTQEFLHLYQGTNPFRAAFDRTIQRFRTNLQQRLERAITALQKAGRAWENVPTDPDPTTLQIYSFIYLGEFERQMIHQLEDFVHQHVTGSPKAEASAKAGSASAIPRARAAPSTNTPSKSSEEWHSPAGSPSLSGPLPLPYSHDGASRSAAATSARLSRADRPSHLRRPQETQKSPPRDSDGKSGMAAQFRDRDRPRPQRPVQSECSLSRPASGNSPGHPSRQASGTRSVTSSRQASGTAPGRSSRQASGNAPGQSSQHDATRSEVISLRDPPTTSEHDPVCQPTMSRSPPRAPRMRTESPCVKPGSPSFSPRVLHEKAFSTGCVEDDDSARYINPSRRPREQVSSWK